GQGARQLALAFLFGSRFFVFQSLPAALLTLAGNAVFEFTDARMHDKFLIEQHVQPLQAVGDISGQRFQVSEYALALLLREFTPFWQAREILCRLLQML